MRMNAVLSNPKHPEYGQFTVAFLAALGAAVAGYYHFSGKPAFDYSYCY